MPADCGLSPPSPRTNHSHHHPTPPDTSFSASSGPLPFSINSDVFGFLLITSTVLPVLQENNELFRKKHVIMRPFEDKLFMSPQGNAAFDQLWFHIVRQKWSRGQFCGRVNMMKCAWVCFMSTDKPLHLQNVPLQNSKEEEEKKQVLQALQKYARAVHLINARAGRIDVFFILLSMTFSLKCMKKKNMTDWEVRGRILFCLKVGQVKGNGVGACLWFLLIFIKNCKHGYQREFQRLQWWEVKVCCFTFSELFIFSTFVMCCIRAVLPLQWWMPWNMFRLSVSNAACSRTLFTTVYILIKCGFEKWERFCNLWNVLKSFYLTL